MAAESLSIPSSRLSRRTSSAVSLVSHRSRSSGSNDSASLDDADNFQYGDGLERGTSDSGGPGSRRKSGTSSIRTSATTPPGSDSPPRGATPGTSLLLRFISSFRPPSSASATPSRPFLPRSLSSPGAGSGALPSTRPPLPTSPLNFNLPAASTSSSSLRKKFRPSFRRRATTGSPHTSPPISPEPSPALEAVQHSPGSPGSSRERDPMDAELVGGVRPAAFHSQGAVGSVRMGKRGSITSQRTVQQGDALRTTPSLPSPLGVHQPVADPLSSPSPASRPPIEHPLSLIATLLPLALLLLSQLGPAHLFSPPLPLPFFGSAFNPSSRRSSVNSTAPIASDQASISSSHTSNSSLPSLGNFPIASAYSHELHAPSTISVPAVSAAAIWRLFRGFEWIGEAGGEGAPPSQEAEEDEKGEEDEKVFDFAALLQGVADVLAADAGARGVELVIGQVGSGGSPSPVTTPLAEGVQLETHEMEKDTASRELLVRADERAWGVVLVWILHHILADAALGATVEVRFLATVAKAPSLPTPESSFGSEDTAIPTRRSLQKWWAVSLEVLHTFSATASPTYDTDTPSPSLPSPAFSTPTAKSLFAQLDLQIGAGPAEVGTQSWIVSGVLPGARPPVDEDDPSTRLGRQRATLGAVGHEPSMDELKKFSVSGLKGTRVAVHAGEQSTFAKHLTMYLAGWGMDVSHVHLDGQSGPSPSGSATSSAQDEGAKGWREGVVRFDSGFGGSNDGGSPSTSSSTEPVNSPLKSTADLPSPGSSNGGAELPSNLVIIDDDVPTLRRMLLALRAPPLHYAPTLMSKRPQLSTRRTRSSPHVRQIHQVPLANANCVIIHFASLTHYKAIKEIVQDALASSRSPSFPDVLVIPKPAGPRRIITALWTALKRPAVDPSLPPIATSPTSPGIQYWTPRLSPALANQQDFDTAAADSLATKGDPANLGPKPRTPPVYFPGGPVGHPPSPLGKISDDQASYFSCVAEGMDGTTPSEGMVIQSPDGRPAIFFQPQTRSVRSASAKERATNRPAERDADLHESPDDIAESPPRTVAAPHEIGLGQGRRMASNSSVVSTESLVLPAGTPALTLDSFITAAKSRINSEVATPDESRNAPTPESILSRAASIHPSISPRNGTGPSPSFVTRRSASGASPPISPNAPPAAQPNSKPGTASPPSFYGRRSSGAASMPRIRRHNTRKSTLPTVPPINVLIVEDNPINQMILSMFMKKKGIKYAVAKDGEEAVQKWKAGNFHLVLMDIQLPVKDGIEATREIREMERTNNVGTFITTPNSDAASPNSSTSGGLSQLNSPTSPLLSMPVIIVALTASSLQIDRVTALAAGCNDFLTKPVSLPWLQQKLLEWGSMAYLSGFSQRGAGSEASSNAGSLRRSAPAINAGLDSKADAISAHLHIDHKGISSSSRSNSPAGRTGPASTVTSPSPVVTPQIDTATTIPSAAAPLAPILIEPAAGGFPELPPPTDLAAVDSRLEDFVSHSPPARPGPSPLSPMRAGDPSLESVVAEGARLVQLGRSRANSFAADSFGQVMHGSGAVSFNDDDVPLVEDDSTPVAGGGKA